MAKNLHILAKMARLAFSVNFFTQTIANDGEMKYLHFRPLP